MAKSKRPRKRRAVRHGVKLVQNLSYWLPINAAVLAQCKSAAIAAVSDEMPDDRLYAAVFEPVSTAIEKLRTGSAEFLDFWHLLQGVYFMSHGVKYVVLDEKFSFDNEIQTNYWRDKYLKILDKLENQYSALLQSVGERQRKHGRYILTGDELRSLLEFQGDMQELLDWCSVRMIYHAALACCKNLETVESQLHFKTKDLRN